MNVITNFTSSIMLYLLAALAVVLLILAAISLRQPLLAKLGARNIPRRPTQSVLIVLGLTLSTIIIMTSLSTGDTLNYSVQAQAVEAYGDIDEVLSPPILATLTQLGVNPDASSEDATQSDLLEGGATSILSLLEKGLPGIDMARYDELRTRVESEPLIDGVAPSIIFPTIIRDNSSGQGEPFGFIFAVDEQYPAQFGLLTVEGEAVDVAGLRPGAGNFFETATQLFGMVTNTSKDIAARLGYDDLTVSDVAMGIAAVGAAITNVQSQSGDALSAENFDLSQLTGIDLQSLGIDPETVNLNQLGDNLLSAVNLNVLGTEIDRVLGQIGLEIRHGDVYLNRLGAEKLNARVGDIVEIYIGPIPLPYRVRGIVDGAGPMAALAPVVVMPLGEAQRLLFMENRINSVLVSNRGDAYAGMQYTAQVNQRLRVLALSDNATQQIVDLLRQPEVRQALDQHVARAVEEDVFGGEEPPPFIADLVNSVIPVGTLAPNLKTLQRELDQPGISDALRQALADRNVQLWLSDLSGLSKEKNDELERAVRGLTEIDLLEPLSKQTVATAASVGGLAFSSVFSLFGIFSILAGVLLIFLIFIMLATERKSEMGMARAIGVQRGQLVQMFITEGMLYDLVAAAGGVLLGLLVSWAMVGFINNLVNDVTGQVGGALGAQSGFFRFRFNVAPISIVIAYCLGVLLTFLIVTIASWRVSRLNIVAAIRDLPESSVTKRRSWLHRIFTVAMGPILIAAAIWLLFISGLRLGPALAQLGTSLLLFGAALTLGWLLSLSGMRADTRNRIAYSLLGFGLLIVWTMSWERWSALLDVNLLERDPTVAVLSIGLSGPLIILGAILVVMYNADSLFWAISRLLGGIGYLTPVLKTAIAYPLSARFRTGMAMLLFAMIISTVVIMSIVIQVTQTLVSPDDERYAGFEIAVNFSLLSFFNPIADLRAEIDRHPDFAKEEVAAVARISHSNVLVDRVRVDHVAREESTVARTLELTSINSEYIEQAQKYYTFQLRAPEYASDADVWQALATRKDVAIVSPAMLEDASQFGDNFDEGGEQNRYRNSFDLRLRRLPGVTSDLSTLPSIELSLRDESPDRQAKMTVHVIGVLAQNETLAGGNFQVNESLAEQLTGAPPANPTFYVKAADGFDPHNVAQDLESAFISGGLNATLSAESFATGQKVTRGVLRLFQGFMALGLLVGIAALGVISSRMVVERRQQIGMLRAIGYQSNMVAFSFLLEASFIALCGIVIGTAAGVIIGQNVIGTLYAVVSGQTFATPWGQIGLIVLLAYISSLITTVLPAFQASRIYPAEALRYE
ncbi:MAG: FtsX-like permease family protein [Caldilineaceae bacterium]|nr:FtsX-like permease family protein [Caldilineaceae bacterium]